MAALSFALFVGAAALRAGAPSLASGRLARLERVVLEAPGARVCRMCGGQPCAVLLVAHEVTANGIRRTGDVYLDDACVGRVMEDLQDLRCAGCGMRARRAAVMYTSGVGPARTGKKLATAGARATETDERKLTCP